MYQQLIHDSKFILDDSIILIAFAGGGMKKWRVIPRQESKNIIQLLSSPRLAYMFQIFDIYLKNIVQLLSRPRWFNSPTALAYCTIDLMKRATFLSLKHNAKVKNPVCGLIRSCRTRLIIFLPELHSASHDPRLPKCESHELRLPGC